MLGMIHVEFLERLRIMIPDSVSAMMITTEETWMDPFVRYSKEGLLLEEKRQA